MALAIYVGVYSCDQGMRTRKGAWEVEFLASTNGAPAIRVNQPALGITNIQVVFAGEAMTNAPGKVVFAKPQQPVPVGRVKFEDLTYLPGSVAFDFFGHEVELLPRTLYLNKEEQGWQSATTYTLTPEEKLPPESFYDPRKKKRRPLDQTGTNSPPAEIR